METQFRIMGFVNSFTAHNEYISTFSDFGLLMAPVERLDSEMVRLNKQIDILYALKWL